MIDETVFCRELVARALCQEGYLALAAAGGAEGLTLLSHHKVSLIILDNQMSHTDGLSFLRQLRGRPGCREIPVILLTGGIQREKVLAAGQFGGNRVSSQVHAFGRASLGAGAAVVAPGCRAGSWANRRA